MMIRDSEKNKRLKDLVLAFCLALVIALIYYYPNFAIPKNLKANTDLSQSFDFTSHPRLSVSGVGDEINYALVMKKVFDGTGGLGDGLIYEHRNDFNPMPPLMYILSGMAAHLFGSVENYFAAVDFIFPFLGTLAVFLFVNIYLKNRIVSLWVTIAIVSMFSAQAMVKMGLLAAPNVASDLIWSQTGERYPSYQLILPYVFLCYALNHRLMNKITWANAVLLGAVAGLSGYVYFYAFLGLSAQIFLIFLWALFIRDFNLAKKYFLAGLVFLVVEIFYIKGILTQMMSPLHLDKALAFGVTTDVADYFYTKDMPKLIGIFLILLLAVKTKLIQYKDAVLLLSMAIPAVLIMHVSGKIMLFPQADHMLNFEFGNAKTIFLGLFLATILDYERLAAFLGRWIGRYGKAFKVLHRVGAVALSLFLIFSSGIVIWKTFRHYNDRATNYYNRYVIERGVADAYDWLNAHAQKTDVILSADVAGLTVMPLKTGMYNYLPNMFLSSVPVGEAWQRFAEAHAFFGADKKAIENLLDYPETATQELNRRLDELKPSDGAAPLRELYFGFNDSLLLGQIFHGYYQMSPKNLSFKTHLPLMSDAEITSVKNYYDKTGFMLTLVPAKVREKYLGEYAPKFADVTQLKFKADYVWLGFIEKKLAGVDSLASESLTEVYRNDAVTLYQIRK